MSMQLNLIIGMTKLINVKKIFTLEGSALTEKIVVKQKQVAAPKKTDFENYDKLIIEIDNSPLYKFSKKGQTTAVLYLPGGGFVLPISGLHWDYLNELSNKVTADFFVGIYPLSPAATIDSMLSFIKHSIEEIKKQGYQEIILMGDSAGGMLSLAALQVEEMKKKIDKVVAISPLVDLILTNPEISQVEKRDSVVATHALYDIRKWLSADHSIEEPILSPIFGEFGDEKILIVSGTRDLTNPDTRKLAQKNERIEYLEYQNLPHVFPLYPIPEAKAANQRIQTFINE